MNGSYNVEIPDFKLARPGNRRRKGGAAGWFGGGAPTAINPALGSTLFTGKTIVTLLLAVGLSGAAWQLGSVGHSSNAASSGKSQTFASREIAAPAASSIVSGSNNIPNSLGYVSGGSGLSAPPAPAASDDKNSAGNGGSDQNGGGSSANAAGRPGLSGGRGGSGDIGRLSSGMNGSGGGSALSGGAGMSGGMGRSFGNSGALGSNLFRGSNGALSNAHRSASAVMARSVGASGSHSQGFAKSQLMAAQSSSRAGAVAGRSETAAAQASSAFDNNSGAGGTPIAGAGVSQGPGGAPIGQIASQAGPINSGGGCGAGMAVGSDGTCQAINSNSTTNSTPYQGLLDTARALMLLVGILSGIAMVIQYVPVWGAGAAKAIQSAITVIGAMIVAIGALIALQYGDMMMGGIVAAVGGLIVASAYYSTQLSGMMNNISTVYAQAAGTMISAAMGRMATSDNQSLSVATFL